MKNKDLIKDIITYLKDNEEARERFNEVSSKKIDYCYSVFDKKKKLGEELYYKGFDIDYFDDYAKNDDKILFLIHALSSPNGKPICGFLEEKECNYPHCYNGHYPLGTHEDGEVDWGSCPNCRSADGSYNLLPINHAKTLRTIYLDALDEGKNHDDAYKLINDKYKKLCKQQKST